MTERPRIQYPKTLRNRIEAVEEYVVVNMPRLPYHNPNHALEVAAVAETFGLEEGCGLHDLYLLATMGLVHDRRYVVGAKDNEEVTVDLIRRPLTEIGYPNYEILIINGGVMATKLPPNPQTALEMVVCDADVDNIGTERFWDRNEAFRIEEGVNDKQTWLARTLKFMESHKYHTKTAYRLRNEGKQKNIAELRKRLGFI